MADLSTHDPDAPPGDDYGDDPRVEALPQSPEGDSLLDDLVAHRERRAGHKRKSFPLPDFDEKLWATYRVTGPKAVVAVMRATADASLKDHELMFACGQFLTHATVGVYMQTAEGERRDFPGHSEDAPASWLDLPSRLVPPRPGGKAHDAVSALRAVFANDTMLVGHALEVANWMQAAQPDLAEAFAGESEGGPR